MATRLLSSPFSTPAAFRRHRRCAYQSRADTGGGGPTSTTEPSTPAEAGARGKSKPRKAQQAPIRPAAKAPPPLPPAGNAQWKEGQLLPEGWDRMDTGRKAVELWAGKRGGLFWLNKIAVASVIGLAAGWVLFRFIGPALGLYELKESFLAPPNL